MQFFVCFVRVHCLLVTVSCLSALNKRKTKFALTCDYCKVILTITFRGRQTFDNLVYLN